MSDERTAADEPLPEVAEPIEERPGEHDDGPAEDYAGAQTDDGWSSEDQEAADNA